MFASEPFGGIKQVGAAIVEERIDFVVFFSDPLEPHPHDMDVKSLQRIALVYNIPVACNRATADFIHLLTADEGRVPPPTMGIEDLVVRWIPPQPQLNENSDDVRDEPLRLPHIVPIGLADSSEKRPFLNRHPIAVGRDRGNREKHKTEPASKGEADPTNIMIPPYMTDAARACRDRCESPADLLSPLRLQ